MTRHTTTKRRVVPLAERYPRFDRDDYTYFVSNDYRVSKDKIGKKQATCQACGHVPSRFSEKPLSALDRHLKTMHPMLWRPLIIDEEADDVAS